MSEKVSLVSRDFANRMMSRKKKKKKDAKSETERVNSSDIKTSD